MYYRKYTVLHNDGNAGRLRADKLWREGNKAKGSCDLSVNVKCACCSSYKEWASRHTSEAKDLHTLADNRKYYNVLADEKVVVDGVQYEGTIRAAQFGPLGSCSGQAFTQGPHPYICRACASLETAKTSTLKRKLLRAKNLKNPRSNKLRATKSGVVHKYCSRDDLQSAVVAHRASNKKLIATEKALHEKWHKTASITPFAQSFLELLDSGKLSAFDLNFMENWVQKKGKGRYAKANEQARSLAILYSNVLGEKLYTTTAPILGLPSARQARRIRAKDLEGAVYLPGLNQWAFDIAAKRECRPLQNGMDGTRITRVIELYQDQYLVGKAFPSDVRNCPNVDSIDCAHDWQQV